MSKILCIGDVHGDYKPFKNIKNYFKSINPLTSDDVIICLGDFGGNFFFNHRDYEYKKQLGYYNATFFIIRGNHEQRPEICAAAAPEMWHTEEFWGNKVYVENAFPYIKYALDQPAKYKIPTAQGTSLQTLVIPGAYSVDKYYRLQNHWSWFEQEQLTKEEMYAGTQLANSQDWDLVLSHTCPYCYEPTDLFLPFIDQSTVDATMEKWLEKVDNQITYKLWLWGHFHNNRIYPHLISSDHIMLSNDYCFNVYKYFCGKYTLSKSLIPLTPTAELTNLF